MAIDIKSPEVSFVIIARNEERRIEECIDSVLNSAQAIESSEVVLVDSRSDDSTVDIAKRFPIRIIRLAEGVALSPAAGRTAGTQIAKGRFIMYIDGDMTIAKNWPSHAMASMQSNDRIGAMYGELASHEKGDDFDSDRDDGDGISSMKSSNRIAGAFMIRRDVLDAIGGMNPHLTGDEEAELSYRIRSHGFDIIRTREVMAVHPPRGTSTLAETMRRYRYGYFRGQGRVLKFSFRQNRSTFLYHLWRLKVYEAYGLWLLMGCILLIASGIGINPYMLLIWSICTMIGIVGLAIRHGVHDVPRRLLSSFFVAIGFVQAAMERTPESEGTILKHEIIQ